jgi:hypothetical protein
MGYFQSTITAVYHATKVNEDFAFGDGFLFCLRVNVLNHMVSAAETVRVRAKTPGFSGVQFGPGWTITVLVCAHFPRNKQFVNSGVVVARVTYTARGLTPW